MQAFYRAVFVGGTTGAIVSIVLLNTFHCAR